MPHSRPTGTRTLAGAIGALCLTLPACTAAPPVPSPASVPPATGSTVPGSVSEPAAQPASGAGPSSRGPAHGGVFSGRRQVALSMEHGPPATLTVDDKGKLVGHVRLTDRSLFVLVPAGDRHQIRTTVLDNAGRPACMGVRTVGDGPDIIVAAACDSRAEGQLYTFTRGAETDSQGRRTYLIGTAAGEVTFNSRDGLHVQPHGEGPATGFAIIDKGPVR
jgi:hypothetical protein